MSYGAPKLINTLY